MAELSEKQRDSLDEDHHRQLLINCFAQGAALMRGRHADDPHRAYPGDRPSTVSSTTSPALRNG